MKDPINDVDRSINALVLWASKIEEFKHYAHQKWGRRAQVRDRSFSSSSMLERITYICIFSIVNMKDA